jgi:hypothetical protein
MIDSFRSLSSSAFSNSFFDRSVVAMLLWRKVAVSLALFDETIRCVTMLVRVVGLKNEFLVIIQPKPLETINDRTCGFISGPLKVGILDTQEELSAHFASEEPIEER